MKNVKVLLMENVANLGIVGDVVDVKPGYARNFLLPHGYATAPSQGAVARLAEKRKQVLEEIEKRNQVLSAMFERLDGHELTLERSANEQGVLYGGVTQHEIAELLRENGFDIEDRAIRIGEQIKRLDSYDIPVDLEGFKAEIKLWVVSDKPAEELEAEEGEAEGEEDQAVVASEETEA